MQLFRLLIHFKVLGVLYANSIVPIIAYLTINAYLLIMPKIAWTFILNNILVFIDHFIEFFKDL